MLIAGVSICKQPAEQSDTSPIELFESSTSVWQRSVDVSARGIVADFVAFIITFNPSCRALNGAPRVFCAVAGATSRRPVIR